MHATNKMTKVWICALIYCPANRRILILRNHSLWDLYRKKKKANLHLIVMYVYSKNGLREQIDNNLIRVLTHIFFSFKHRLSARALYTCITKKAS